MKPTHLQSKLRLVRGWGAAHRGVEHWWLQRLTALALLPISIWFLASFLCVAQSTDPFRVADWLGSPVAAVLMVAFLVAMFWHAKLGLQVVIEDYVHKPGAKFTLLVLNSFICWGAAAAGIIAVLRLHMFDLVSGGV